MENVNGINKVWGTYHCGTSPGGPCDETNGLSGQAIPTGPPLQGNFHVYTIEIDRTDAALEVMNWYLDDVLYWSVKQAAVPAEVWAATVHNSFFILLNYAIGCQFPDKEWKSPTPLPTTVGTGTMLVNYVAVFNTPETSTSQPAPAAAPPPAPTCACPVTPA